MGKGVFQQDKILGLWGMSFNILKGVLWDRFLSAQRESISTCLVSVLVFCF